LESIKIECERWEIDGKVHSKINHLTVFNQFDSPFNIEMIPKSFPNLNYLDVQEGRVRVTIELFVLLLSELKQLKVLEMGLQIESGKLSPGSLLRCFEQYGQHLKRTDVGIFKSKPPNWTIRVSKNAGYPYSVNKM
jgi:hypothetical protein